MKKPRSIGSRINEHRHPAWMYRYPRTVVLLWVWFIVLYQRTWVIRARLRRYLSGAPTTLRVLDAGCGEGLFLLPAARKHARHRFEGVDLRGANIELCERYREQLGLTNLSLRQADLTQLEARPADLILCVGVLHCIPEDEQALAQLAAVLSPRGRLLLYTPLNRRRVLPGFERLFRSTLNYEAHHAQHIYTDEKLTQKINTAGLWVEDRHFTNGTLGIIGYELVTGAFLIANRPGFLLKIIGYPLFLLLVPVQLLLNLLDLCISKKDGNGCLYEIRHDQT